MSGRKHLLQRAARLNIHLVLLHADMRWLVGIMG
jgi:hypothetical protein